MDVENSSQLADNLDYQDDDYYDYLMNILSERDFLPPPLPTEFKVILVIAYLIIISISALGNAMVICIIGRYHKMRTVTNTFLGSLAVSDLLIALVNMPMQLHYYLANEWTAGQIPCKLANYVQGVTIVVSILTLTAVAMDRYYAICRPLQARIIHTNKRAYIMLTCFWIASLILISPQLFIQRLEPLVVLHPEDPENMVSISYVCVEYFPEACMSVSYTVFFYVILYLAPVLIMCLTYGKIAYTLWLRTPVDDLICNQAASRRVEEKRRIIRMLVVIVALFTICWFPFFTCQIFVLFYDNLAFHKVPFRITMAVFKLVGYSNCCINPIVYCLLSESFRQHFVKTICNGLKRLTGRHSRFSNDTSKLQPPSTNTSV